MFNDILGVVVSQPNVAILISSSYILRHFKTLKLP